MVCKQQGVTVTANLAHYQCYANRMTMSGIFTSFFPTHRALNATSAAQIEARHLMYIAGHRPPSIECNTEQASAAVRLTTIFKIIFYLILFKMSSVYRVASGLCLQ